MPLRALLRYSLDRLQGKEVPYPFSREGDRTELSDEYSPHLSAVVLQEALYKIKKLANDYERLTKIGALSLYVGKADRLTEAQFLGFFQDLIFAITDLDVVDKVDDIEDILYRHAKSPNVELGRAVEILGDVEALIFKFTFRTEIARSLYEKESSPILRLLRKSEGRILIPY